MRAPVCPECQYEFTLLRSLRHWNPFKTTCPQCAAKLRLRRATLFLSSAIFGGLILAGVAILGDQPGLWGYFGGNLFIISADFFFVVPFAIYLWSRQHYVLRQSA